MRQPAGQTRLTEAAKRCIIQAEKTKGELHMRDPLANRLRPQTLDDVCGQQHLLAPGKVFRRTVDSGTIPNMIFYGPSGVGKTTVARKIMFGMEIGRAHV